MWEKKHSVRDSVAHMTKSDAKNTRRLSSLWASKILRRCSSGQRTMNSNGKNWSAPNSA